VLVDRLHLDVVGRWPQHFPFLLLFLEDLGEVGLVLDERLVLRALLVSDCLAGFDQVWFTDRAIVVGSLHGLDLAL
jgi:hypothetical protein